MRPVLPSTLLLVVTILCGAAAGEYFVSRAESPDEVVCNVPGAAPTATPRWELKREQKERKKAHTDDPPPAGGALVPLPGIPEASGLAVSRRTPGILWTFNDSDDPRVYALDTTGAIKGRVTVRGVETKNWEDISAAACGNQSCLYIADIGDNHERRATITVYRVPEPAPTDTETAPADALTAKYPDFPHDAEALFVTHDDGLFIVTKDKPATVYRFPQPLQPGRVMTLQEVALLPMENVTDAEASPDDVWVGIRSKEEMLFFRRRELASGGTEHGEPIDLRGFKEPQGEGVAIAGDGRVYLASEGGNKDAPGTFTSMTCRFPAVHDGGP